MNTMEGDPKTEPRVGYNYKSVNLRGWTILYSRSAGHTLITHTCLQTKAADFTLKLLESSMLLKTCTNWTHIFAQKMCWRQSFNYKPLRLQNIYNSIKNFNNYICINVVACYCREFYNMFCHLKWLTSKRFLCKNMCPISAGWNQLLLFGAWLRN